MAKLVGIRDVGVEDWFYSRKSIDGQPTLDDPITDIERDLSSTVNDLRATPVGGTVNPNLAALCIVHLVMRTDHLRGIMTKGFSNISEEIQSLFSDPSRLENMFGLNSFEIAPRVTEAISNKARELISTGIPSAFAERIMSFLVRENGDDIVHNIATSFAPYLPLIFADLTNKVRDAHNQILEMPTESNGWVNALSGFCWTIQAGKDLILPDSIALAAEEGNSLVPLLFARAANAKAVVMPISKTRILVGIPPDRELIDLTLFNQQAAACSEAFFIGGRSYDDDGLASLIGSGPTNAIRHAIEGAIRGAEVDGVAAPEIYVPSRDNHLELDGFTYTLRLADFGDESLAKELVGMLQTVVGELSRRLPLHYLDGFTIARDYHAALLGLDRGDETLPPLTSSALKYGAGIAKPVSVKRNGIRKEHVVIDAEIALAWLSEDKEARETALSVLIKMLAIVAHAALFADEADKANVLPPDPMVMELHSAVAMTPSAWFSARETAFIAPCMGKTHADLMVASLDFTERQLAEERIVSQKTGDVGNVTRRSTECISATLLHAADWLGHRAGLLDGQRFEGYDLPARLQSRGLDKWLELFGRDLAAIYETESAGLNLSAVTRLSRHVERLLWTHGIYAWPEDNEVRCLVTNQGFIPQKFR